MTGVQTCALPILEDNRIYVGIGILLARCVRMQDLSAYRDTNSVLFRRILDRDPDRETWRMPGLSKYRDSNGGVLGGRCIRAFCV